MLSNPSIIYRIRGGLGSPMDLARDELPISQLHKGHRLRDFSCNTTIGWFWSFYRTWVFLHTVITVVLRMRILSDAIRVKIATPLHILNRNLDFVKIWSNRWIQFGFCENWWLEPSKMEPWKMIGFGRDTHVNHEYLVTSSSRAVHFIGQPKIPKHIRQWNEFFDSKVAPQVEIKQETTMGTHNLHL